jgi:hypothetical protein
VVRGIDLPTVPALLGHKDISMTLRYTPLSSSHKQRAVKALEGFGEKVPPIFPTARLEQIDDQLHMLDFASMGR